MKNPAIGRGNSIRLPTIFSHLQIQLLSLLRFYQSAGWDVRRAAVLVAVPSIKAWGKDFLTRGCLKQVRQDGASENGQSSASADTSQSSS